MEQGLNSVPVHEKSSFKGILKDLSLVLPFFDIYLNNFLYPEAATGGVV